MVVLVARCRLLTERRAEAYEACEAMLAPSRAEPGCISYEFFVHPDDPDYISFVEEWQSNDALQEHFATDHFQAFYAAMQGMMTEPADIRIYDVRGRID